MIAAPYGYALGLTYYFILLCLALVAHGVWVVRTARAVWLWQQPRAVKLAAILAAFLTPIVGFYGVLVIQYFRRPPSFRLPVSKWTFIMPVLVFCVVLYLAMRQNWRYTEASHSWANVVRYLPGFFAFYCVTHLVLYMAARVFGLAHHGPLTTRVQLVSMAVVVLAVRANFP
jgi:hypothetical protein